MIDRIFIEKKIDLIKHGLTNLETLKGYAINEIMQDFIKYAALKNILMEIIGRAIDINEHLIAEVSDPTLKSPKTYKETFTRLQDLGILPSEFTRQIAQSAGFRNAIVHDYNNLDEHIVYRTVDEALEQYLKYCEYILAYLDQRL